MSDPQSGSKAKYVRDLLDKAVEFAAPRLSPEEFEREFGMRLTAEEIRRLTMADVLVRQLVLKAAKGNDKSISEVLDRLLGKPMQTTEAVIKSYSYQDLLIQLKQADEPREAVPAPREILVRALAEPEETDILADFL